MSRTIVIIPARGGSKRLIGKNIYPLLGKPLIAYTIEACQQCDFIDDIYVSSDDDEILSTSEAHGAIALRRPAELADDHTPKVVAIRQAAKDPALLEKGDVDTIIIAQANSPEISADQIRLGYELMQNHKLWEVMSADDNGVQNAAFRIVKYHALFNEFLSAHCGFVVANNIDVHTIEDIHHLEEKMKA